MAPFRLAAIALRGPRSALKPGGTVTRSYGLWRGRRHGSRRGWLAALVLLFAPLGFLSAPSNAGSLHLVAVGDSLTAGYGLPTAAAFPSELERALKAKGYAVDVTNAGVSGDTAEDGLARLDWSVPAGTNVAIVELGANDMLRGLDPDRTRDTLGKIIAHLKERGIKVLLAGMRATPSLGADYAQRFDAIYPSLSKQYDVPLYPFFLEGVFGNAKLCLADGLHPNATGVEVIVSRILPAVEALLKEVKA